MEDDQGETPDHQRKPINAHQKWKLRITCAGALLAALALYLDLAHAWPGGDVAATASGFTLVAVGLLIVAAYCLLNLIYGSWLLPSQVTPEESTVARVSAQQGLQLRYQEEAKDAVSALKGPVSQAEYREVLSRFIRDSPPDPPRKPKNGIVLVGTTPIGSPFFDEAKRVYEDSNTNDDLSFEEALIGIYKSAGRGRPIWFFLVFADATLSSVMWITVNHPGPNKEKETGWVSTSTHPR